MISRKISAIRELAEALPKDELQKRAALPIFREYGISEIMEMKKGILSIRPETFSCDAYSFYSGDSSVINSFHGEYMNSYSWAGMTESFLYWKSLNNT